VICHAAILREIELKTLDQNAHDFHTRMGQYRMKTAEPET